MGLHAVLGFAVDSTTDATWLAQIASALERVDASKRGRTEAAHLWERGRAEVRLQAKWAEVWLCVLVPTRMHHGHGLQVHLHFHEQGAMCTRARPRPVRQRCSPRKKFFF